jgi:Dolichyl-phosphate-mannose-protein mannosyltransferase
MQVDVGESSIWSGGPAIAIYLAIASTAIHVATGGRYGFHRDELATLYDARHLAWGYVAYPPVTPFFGRLSLIFFGTSLAGFRFFAALAEAAALVLTAIMARELGGGRAAQAVAAAGALPFCTAGGALMQYVSFDYLAWVLTAYFVVRLLGSQDPRWWLAVGGAAGFGLLSKYSMPFLVCGILLGFLLTSARRYLLSKWFLLGTILALLVFLPNFLWQAQHHFVSLDFLRHIHERDVRIGRANGFIVHQLNITLLAFPLCMCGLAFYLFSVGGKPFRPLAWMYIVPLLLFFAGKGRAYYLGPAYPMLYAAGSVLAERWISSLKTARKTLAWGAVWTALTIDAIASMALTLPIAPVHSSWARLAFKINGDFAEEIGWPELVETVAQIRESLPAADRAHLGILATNYGEAGAIDLYGPDYGLPPAISGVNSFWQHGYGNPPPETLIVIGLSREHLDRIFSSCVVAGHTWNRYEVMNEETKDHPDIFVCRKMRFSWPEFWANFRYYG